MTCYNRIKFEYGPWGESEAVQVVVNGYETDICTLDGTELPIAGKAYGYNVIEENISVAWGDKNA